MKQYERSGGMYSLKDFVVQPTSLPKSCYKGKMSFTFTLTYSYSLGSNKSSIKKESRQNKEHRSEKSCKKKKECSKVYSKTDTFTVNIFEYYSLVDPNPLVNNKDNLVRELQKSNNLLFNILKHM